MKTFVLVDGGYYNYYHFFATFSSFKRKTEGEPLTKEACVNDPHFLTLFEKKWLDTIGQIAKKFYANRSDIIFARDGRNVWRYKEFSEYKATRNNRELYPIFDHVSSHCYPKLKEEGIPVIQVQEAEADDIIYVVARVIHEKIPTSQIVVISGDHDLFQIPNVEFYELAGWKKNIPTNLQKELMLKILAGDKSDNIPPAFKGCGKKTAEKLAQESPEELERILTEKGCYEQYFFNKVLIDFSFIPAEIVDKIEGQINNLFTP